MKKKLLSIALAAIMSFGSIGMNTQTFAANGVEITATKDFEAPYNGKEYESACDKTKASEANPKLPSGWEWENPDLELTTEFQETVVIQRDISGNEKNRVTVKVKKGTKASGPAAPSGLTAKAPTTKSGTDGKVTGVDDTMEYSLNNGETWTGVLEGATEITGFKEADEVCIRIKETADTLAGAIKIVTIPVIPADTKAPTGSIKITTNVWNSFLNTITFGQLFKETKTVTIESKDDVAVASVKYYVSDLAFDLDIVKTFESEWIDYPSGGFTLEPTDRYVVYAMITDTSDNVTYLSSDGLIFLTETAPKPLVTEVTDKSFTIKEVIDEIRGAAAKEVGIYYRKKDDTDWIRKKADEISADTCVVVDNLTPGTDYEVITYAIYLDDIQITMPKENATTLTTDATFKPLGNISVKLVNDSDEVKDAVITIEKGNNVIASVLKKNIMNDGVAVDSGYFKEPDDGVYNVVVRTTDGKYVETKMITVTNGKSNIVEFIISKGELESVVSIKGEDTPPIAVDGLGDVLVNNEKIISDEEKEQIENGDIKVELVFEAEKKNKSNAVGGDAMSRLAEKSGLLIDLFLDLSLSKVTTQLTGEHAGENKSIDIGSVNKSVLEIAVPYDTTKDKIGAFRCHNGVVSALTSLEEKPADDLKDGTFFVGDGYVYIYGSGFSTYGLGGPDGRPSGPAAPKGLSAKAPTSKGGKDGQILGVTTAMEYSTDNGRSWTPVTSSVITGLTPGKVLVRYAGTDTVKPGASAEVTVPDYSKKPGKGDGPAAPGGLAAKAPTSKGGRDGQITGVDPSMEYSDDDGRTWKPVTGNSIDGLAAGVVLVRIKETDDREAGAIARVTVPAFKDPYSPPTGDVSSLSFWISMLLIGAMVFFIVLITFRINRKIMRRKS